MNKKAMIAMSGGVDSSVAALRMLERGWDCLGATMRLYRSAEKSKYPVCCSEDDARDAADVCDQLGISHIVLDYTAEFDQRVIEKFARVYAAGGTPNPCIDCNRYLKFEKLLSTARRMGCDCLATGHYARIGRDPATGRFLLKKAAYAAKDQSYVLYMLDQEQLARLCFPLGDLTKPQVREIADEHGFVNSRKHDSQDICFVPDRDYARFLEQRMGRKMPEGDFVDADGNVLGTHRGILHYTLGQRRGLGVPGEAPYYVSRIDPETNTVTLGGRESLLARTVYAEEINLISLPRIEGALRAKAKLRYRQVEQPCTVTQEGGRLKLVFDEPQRAPTPGQAAVIYDGDVVVGGGTIC